MAIHPLMPPAKRINILSGAGDFDPLTQENYTPLHRPQEQAICRRSFCKYQSRT